MSLTKALYENHHEASRAPGFSILKDERGNCFSQIIGTGKSVLDIGCRDGALTVQYLTENTVLGADIDEKALVRASESGVPVLAMDLSGSWNELQGKRFDAIVAGEFLEHMFYPENIVHKAHEHLYPDGIFIGSVPNAFSLKNRLRYLLGTTRHTPLSDPTHINQFSAASLRRLLGMYFKDVEITGLGRYARLARLNPNWFAFDLIFIARKQA